MKSKWYLNLTTFFKITHGKKREQKERARKEKEGRKKENNKVKWPKGMCSVEVPYKGMLYKMELFISIL